MRMKADEFTLSQLEYLTFDIGKFTEKYSLLKRLQNQILNN